MHRMTSIATACLALALSAFATAHARAETASDFRSQYEQQARQSDPGYSGAAAARGESFFRARHGTDWSCATCHGDRPVSTGRHASTGKPIDPLAPSANPERFTRAEKVEKWFKRNCNDVLGRACTPAEKADVLAYLVTLGK